MKSLDFVYGTSPLQSSAVVLPTDETVGKQTAGYWHWDWKGSGKEECVFIKSWEYRPNGNCLLYEWEVVREINKTGFWVNNWDKVNAVRSERNSSSLSHYMKKDHGFAMQFYQSFLHYSYNMVLSCYCPFLSGNFLDYWFSWRK